MNLIRAGVAVCSLSIAILVAPLEALASPAKLDAAAYDTNAREYYFFSGDAVFVKPRKGQIGPPKAISDVFTNWPESWQGHIDAATYHDKKKVFYFFRGSEFASSPVGGPVSEPTKIVGNWPGWPREFGDGDVEAVIYSTKQKRFYYFKNQQFSRHKEGKGPNPATAMETSSCSGTLCDGSDFPGWPFRGSIDAASYVQKDKSYYFYADATYGAKPYGKSFDEYGGIEGTFENWPEQELIASFSPEPALDLAQIQDDPQDDAIKLLIQTGHSDAVRYVNYLDDSRIVSIGFDGIARIWDIQTGKETHRLGKYSNPTEVFALVDDQRRWLLLADTQQVTQWDIKTLEKIRTFPISGIQSIEIHNDFLSVMFPRDSSRVQVRVINLSTAEEVTQRIGLGQTTRRLSGGVTSSTGAASIMYADRHPDRNLIVSASTDAKLRLWQEDKKPIQFGLSPSKKRRAGKFFTGLVTNAIGGTAAEVGNELANVITEGIAHAANRVIFSPDGNHIVSAHFNGKVVIWNLKGKRVREIQAHEGRIHDLRFSLDGNRLLTTGSDSQIKVWDFQTGEIQRSLGGAGSGHAGEVTSAAFSPDGKMILSGGADRSVLIWDENGAVARRFERRAPAVSFVRFHPDNSTFVTADRFDPFIRRWNISDASLAKSFSTGSTSAVTAMSLSPDGRLIAIGSFDRKVSVYDLATGAMTWQEYHKKGDDAAKSIQKSLMSAAGGAELIDETFRNKIGIRSLKFTADSSGIVSVADNSSRAIIWDSETGEQLRESGMRVGMGAAMDVSPTGTIALSHDLEVAGTAGVASVIVMWTPGNKGKGKMNPLGSGFASGASPKRQYRTYMARIALLPDDQHVIGVAGRDIALWNIEEEERVQGYYGHEGDIIALDVDGTGSILVTGSTDNTVRSWDIMSGEQIGTFVGHSGRIHDLDISADGRYLITGSSDGTARLWNLQDQQELASFTAVGREDYVVNTPDNYYTASKGAASGLAFSKGGKTYPFDQFDLQLNRPDLVLERIDMASNSLRKAYAQAAQKRLRKHGIYGETEFTGNLPSLAIDSPIPVSTLQRTINLSVTATDSMVPITRLLVNVNDVPVYGSTGLALPAGQRSIAYTFPVTLSNGRNKLQISVRNSDGYESLRETREVTFVGEEIRPDLHIAVIGVSEYIDDAIPDLVYPTKDAADIADAFAAQRRFANVYEYRLLDGDATKANIEALKNNLAQSRVDDLVVVFVAGHGLLDDNLDYFFAPTDLQLAQVTSTGVPYETLEGLLDGIPARNKLLMMDTCHAGDPDEDKRRQLLSSQGGSKRGLKVAVVEKTTVIDRPSSSIPELAGVFDLMKSLFVNLDRGSGAVVISAAASNQYALESEQWQNGVFTYSVLEGIRSGAADLDQSGGVSASELHRHVATMVEDLTGGAQVPTTRREQSEFDFRVF